MRWLARPVLAVAAAVCLHAPQANASSLDSPTVRFSSSTRVSVQLLVTAGVSGAPGGFVLEWMKSSDYALTGWPAAPAGADIEAVFDGTPTVNVAWGASSFALKPNQSITLDVGQLFDETGLNDAGTDPNSRLELDENTDYVFRARARGTVAQGDSGHSKDCHGHTQPPGSGCTFSQGCWKNHPVNWPVQGLVISGVTYTHAQLLSILRSPAKGNGLLVLMHQLIAARLNFAMGATSPSVATSIAAAEALIGGRVCPPVGGGTLAPSTTTSLAATLDTFNTGQNSSARCGSLTPVRVQTWGQLKSLYR